MSNYTLTFSEDVRGWPSFYSFYPDWMIGMNNYFYTFKGGNLYRHNVNNIRNNFYGVQYSTTLTSVFNDGPLDNKLWKTLSLQGTDAWNAIMYSDIQDSGFINAPWFEKKEQVFFAFVRNSGDVPAGVDEYPLRSLNGIGRSASVVAIPVGYQINFATSVTIEKGIMSVGDMVYFALPPYTSPQLAGQIVSVTVDLRNGINRIEVDTSIPGSIPIPIQDAYFLYIKNAVAESHGVLGHYCVFAINNSNSSQIELFAVEADVMKSYP